uniref:Secreted protein n=1 Tax=Thraustotheca clavata TaxID=74557 RepID=A0A0A7CMM6_9STRA|nr:secreted protein [Thraustotheca clavata]
MNNCLLLFLAFLASVCASDPRPNSKAIVLAGNARFTVLTESVIRMEWSASHSFRDDRTMVIANRKLPVPSFNASTEAEGWIKISTAHLVLQYQHTSRLSFNDDNLRVIVMDVNGTNATWLPSLSDNDPGRLDGTIRTLDMTNGSVNLNCNAGGPDFIADSHCTDALISKRGYVVVDDSLSYQLDNSTWPWLMKFPSRAVPAKCNDIPKDKRRICGKNIMSKSQCEVNGCCYDNITPLPNGFECFYSASSYQDMYFLGHGHKFKDALYEFMLLSGPIPLPPRYAFGVFYSKWWAYSDSEVDNYAHDYATRSIPLDTVVLDMDWHLTFYNNKSLDQADQPMGWTGYTWNKMLFPSPKAFLSHLHEMGLHVTLNLHPASGVQPWETSYPSVAHAMGIDPSTQVYVPFDLVNKTFATTWLTLSIKPIEDDGVDFWWLDWQQGEDWFVAHDQANMNINPTLWLNYVFFTNPHHWGKTQRRPLLLHRFGGLGSHRYPVGFSGDVEASWASLAFQPQFTISASNVGFSYWSHDLGGFLHGYDPELFTRWIQWGAFSPIFRTHSMRDVNADRRIWKYPAYYYTIMRDYMNLRSQLIPYIYTECRHTYESGLGLVHGLYFEWPQYAESYKYSNQYRFGRSYLVAPIVQPLDKQSKVVERVVWLPPGVWYDVTFGSLIHGPSGTILPMSVTPAWSLGQAQIIPGVDFGRGTMYEDEGNSQNYESEHSWTYFQYQAKSNGSIELTISKSTGKFTGMITERAYVLNFRHSAPAVAIFVDDYLTTDEMQIEGWRYDATRLSIQVLLKPRSVDKPINITLTGISIGTTTTLNNARGLIVRLQQVKSLLDNVYVYQDDFPHLLEASQIHQVIGYNVSQFEEKITHLIGLVRKGVQEVQNLPISKALKTQISQLLTPPRLL